MIDRRIAPLQKKPIPIKSGRSNWGQHVKKKISFFFALLDRLKRKKVVTPHVADLTVPYVPHYAEKNNALDIRLQKGLLRLLSSHFVRTQLWHTLTDFDRIFEAVCVVYYIRRVEKERMLSLLHRAVSHAIFSQSVYSLTCIYLFDTIVSLQGNSGHSWGCSGVS